MAQNDILPPALDNLRTFSKTKWLNRTTYENYKYFTKQAVDNNVTIALFAKGSDGNHGSQYTDGDTIDHNKNGFLSPSSVRLINQAPIRMVNNGFIPDTEYFNYEKYYNMFCDIINFNLNKSLTSTVANLSADFGKTLSKLGDYVDLDIVEIKKDSYAAGGKIAKLFTREKLNEIFNNHFSLLVQDPEYLKNLKIVNDGVKYLLDNPAAAASEEAQLKINIQNPQLFLGIGSDPDLNKDLVVEIFNDMLENIEALPTQYPPPQQDRGMNTVSPLLGLLRLFLRGEDTYYVSRLTGEYNNTSDGFESYKLPPMPRTRYHIDNYNLNNSTNLLETLRLAKQHAALIDPEEEGDHLLSPNDISRIPNANKSLFLANSHYNVPIEDIVWDPNNPLDDFNMKTRKNFFLEGGGVVNKGLGEGMEWGALITDPILKSIKDQKRFHLWYLITI